MKPGALQLILDQLGGKHIARVSIETMSGDRFEMMAVMSGAAVTRTVVCDDGGAMTVSRFERLVDGVVVEVVHRRPANVIELREAAQ